MPEPLQLAMYLSSGADYYLKLDDSPRYQWLTQHLFLGVITYPAEHGVWIECYRVDSPSKENQAQPEPF